MSKIEIKGIIEEDFVNYKLPCMTIMFPRCSFKCGKALCQNSELVKMDNIIVDSKTLVLRYMNNPITKAFCFQGLEPFDSLDMFDLVQDIRAKTKDDIVIYTGYTHDEVDDAAWLGWLRFFPNIVIKYGRYFPGQEPHMDDVLGVPLASDNQYAVRES